MYICDTARGGSLRAHRVLFLYLTLIQFSYKIVQFLFQFPTPLGYSSCTSCIYITYILTELYVWKTTSETYLMKKNEICRNIGPFIFTWCHIIIQLTLYPLPFVANVCCTYTLVYVVIHLYIIIWPELLMSFKRLLFTHWKYNFI